MSLAGQGQNMEGGGGNPRFDVQGVRAGGPRTVRSNISSVMITWDPPMWTDRHESKHYLPATPLAGSKNTSIRDYWYTTIMHQTRMHSSRMRTVSYSGRRGRGCLPGRGVWPEGGVCPGQVSDPVHAGIHTPSMDRILDTRLWKHYLSATTLRTVITHLAVKNHYLKNPN